MNSNSIIIDVREKDEFCKEHIENSILLPLSDLNILAPGILAPIKDQNLLLLCRSGNRAKLALNQIQSLDLKIKNISVYEGGILNWKKQGHPVIRFQKSTLPLMRQVQIAAGFLIITSVLLSIFVDPKWIGLGLFVGCGLTFAGLTGFCGMAILLSKMPWNQTKKTCSTGSSDVN